MNNIIKRIVLVALVATIVWSMFGCCCVGAREDRSAGELGGYAAARGPTWPGRPGL